jgi:hypothetical protein
MNSLKKIFDDFTFHARVMPVLIVLIPVFALGVAKGILDGELWKNTWITLVLVAFLSLASRVAREIGKSYEEKMFKKLGGKPTTILLRYSNEIIDNLSKTRYHQKLNETITDLNLPINKRSESGKSDDKYDSAINWLRNYANTNRDKEYRVYQELKEYNFWRNLYGLKLIAFSMYLLIAIREVYIMEVFSFSELLLQPFPKYIAFLIMVISTILIFLFVSKNTVKRKAFDYAKALVEVCERL